MDETNTSERAAYEEARSAFERLETQDKVAFVVEATLTTLGRGAAAVVEGLASAFDDIASERKSASEKEPPTTDTPSPDADQP